MDERQEKSILEMGRGDIMERADYEMSAMIRNILDPNTSSKAARKLNITLTFKPGDDRQIGAGGFRRLRPRCPVKTKSP